MKLNPKVFNLGLSSVLLILVHYLSFSQGLSLQEPALSNQERTLFHKEELSFRNNRNSFLKWTTQGQELALQGRFKESNEYFENAFLLLENKENQLSRNEKFGFEYEIFMLLYLKSLNYCSMRNPEDALVECNRMKEWMSKDSARHCRNQFKDEPMPHVLMGIIYEAEGLHNDAFIEYRSAYRLYQENYLGFFGCSSPRELQKSILQTALLAGLVDDFSNLSEEFNLKNYSLDKSEGGELIFIWHMGVGPYQKEEPADFEINANSLSGKLLDSTLGVAYKFETAFQINLWKEYDWWTSLPRGIYYVHVPLQRGLNKFELTVYNVRGDKKIIPIQINGDGHNQIQVFTSFLDENVESDNQDFNYVIESGDSKKIKEMYKALWEINKPKDSPGW